MSGHRFLESFDTNAPTADDRQYQASLEAARSEGYEAGYTSGWEDAIASDKTSRMRLEAEFERNVQNIAINYTEAISHVRDELGTFLTELIDGFFPSITPLALREHIRCELHKIGEEVSDTPIEIVASPDCRAVVSDMLKAEFSVPIHLVEDTSLSLGQVYLRLGSKEVEIDLEPLVKAVSDQLKAITITCEKETGND